MTCLPVLAQSSGSEIAAIISPLLIHAVIWAIFIIWAGLVLLVPPKRDEEEDEFDDQYLAEEEAETAGAKAAGIVLYLIAVIIVIFASIHHEIPALIAAGILCLAGLVVGYLVRLQVRAARIALGAALLGGILGGVVIAQYIHTNLWETREQIAVDMLRKIHEAETRYYKRKGIVGDLGEIAKHPFGGPEIPGGSFKDYIFEVREDLHLQWIVTARPDSPFPWVIAYFFMDSSGKIRYQRGKPADVSSPIWRR
ncbi:MAG: hypothetical protein ACYS8W_05575 [Planctomycetota bacterium]|jgi:hypothetical protein